MYITCDHRFLRNEGIFLSDDSILRIKNRILSALKVSCSQCLSSSFLFSSQQRFHLPVPCKPGEPDGPAEAVFCLRDDQSLSMARALVSFRGRLAHSLSAQIENSTKTNQTGTAIDTQEMSSMDICKRFTNVWHESILKNRIELRQSLPRHRE